MSDANEWADFEFKDGGKCSHRNVIAIQIYHNGILRRISLESLRDFLSNEDHKGCTPSSFVRDSESKIENKDPTDELNSLDPTKCYFTYPPVYCKNCPLALQPPNACPHVLKVMSDQNYNCPKKIEREEVAKLKDQIRFEMPACNSCENGAHFKKRIEHQQQVIGALQFTIEKLCDAIQTQQKGTIRRFALKYDPSPEQKAAGAYMSKCCGGCRFEHVDCPVRKYAKGDHSCRYKQEIIKFTFDYIVHFVPADGTWGIFAEGPHLPPAPIAWFTTEEMANTICEVLRRG